MSVCWPKVGGTAAFTAILVLGIDTAFAEEQTASHGDAQKIRLSASLKLSELMSFRPDGPEDSVEEYSSTSLFRLRLGMVTKHNEWISTEAAYEQRARLISDDAATVQVVGALPSEAKAPYRTGQLDWKLGEHGNTFIWRHEVDRAFVSIHPEWGEIKLGRQAIGLGRGVLFSAVDVFSPFSPLEVDREWRRGIDAARLECGLGDRSSAELITAFGEDWAHSALLGRVRGYTDDLDCELILGKRAGDFMYAGTMSAAAFKAEMHLELAVFDTPERQLDEGLFGHGNLAGKAVAGTSYTFGIGKGLTVLVEYHYSGFGVRDIQSAAERLQDPVFKERYLRGDMQMLGRHALAAQFSYPLTSTVSCSMLIMDSPVDGSGIVAPSINWSFTQNASLVVSGFVPWGADTQGRSEYGAAPKSLFLQLSSYY